MKDLYLRNRELRLFEDDLSEVKDDSELYKPTLNRFYMLIDN